MSEQSSLSRDVLIIPVTEEDHAQGPGDAPLTLVEYGDFECPDCGQAYPVVKQLREEFGDRLRFIYRHFPRNTIHQHAGIAAQASEAAAAQEKFWPMHQLLFKNQKDLANADLVSYALRAGLELYRFEGDLSSARFADKVEQDYEGGQLAGVTGTPTFFINGRRYRGEMIYDALSEALRLAMVAK
jgi:protein-disulfide isomerase